MVVGFTTIDTDPAAMTDYSDLLVTTPDEPGVLADVLETLSAAGVDVDGLSAFTGGGRALIHLLVATPMVAQTALEKAGFTVAHAELVEVLNIPDRPLALGMMAKELVEDDLNVRHCYLALGPKAATRIVITTDPR